MMRWTLPPDLDARRIAARTKAEIAFNDAKANRSPADIRRLLIEVRIPPEVMEVARCACEAARSGLWRASAVEGYVDDYLHSLARMLCPDGHVHSASSDSFIREAVERVTKSPEWRAYLAERQRVAELLATAASTPKDAMPLTAWSELEVRFLSEQTVQIFVNGQAYPPRNYAELGFEDRRTENPALAWETLLEIARYEGRLKVDRSVNEYVRQGTRIREIRRRLRALFSCTADPLPLVENHYQAQFRVTRAAAFDSR